MVIWSEPAREDLRAIFAYIARDSYHYAKKVTQEIVDKTGALNELPRMGRKVPELDEETVRELALYAYRILYEIKTDRVEVLAVIHKRQHLASEDIPRGA